MKLEVPADDVECPANQIVVTTAVAWLPNPMKVTAEALDRTVMQARNETDSLVTSG